VQKYTPERYSRENPYGNAGICHVIPEMGEAFRVADKRLSQIAGEYRQEQKRNGDKHQHEAGFLETTALKEEVENIEHRTAGTEGDSEMYNERMPGCETFRHELVIDVNAFS
jgi:hypothetical protein